MPQGGNFLRYASPNERRTISREDLGHYHAVIIAAIYSIPTSFSQSTDISEFLYTPLAECIAAHPFLSVTVKDRHTEKQYYERVSEVKLAEHVENLGISLVPLAPNKDANIVSGETKELVESLFQRDLDRPFREGIPPWRVFVVPLSPSGVSTATSTKGSDKESQRYLIAFEYSHAIGDGPSGVAFHRTLLSALEKSKLSRANSSHDQELMETGKTKPPASPFPEPFDTPERLRISWGFLLAPLLGAILPSFIANLLGLKAQASSTDEDTWTGTPCFYDPEQGAKSRAVLVTIPSDDVSNAITEARKHGAKLTGVIHCLVVRALGRALHKYNDGKGERQRQITNFVGTTAINMRGAIGIPDSDMGEFASGVYTTFPVSFVSAQLIDGETRGLGEQEWAAAREATLQFADGATRLHDQPIGLLRYVPGIRKWIQGKLGKSRDATYEVSNLGCVDLGKGNAATAPDVEVENMFFAQPGHVTSHALNFNIVSTKSGGMTVCITWPTGSLGLEGPEEEEEKFLRGVGKDLARWFKSF